MNSIHENSYFVRLSRAVRDNLSFLIPTLLFWIAAAVLIVLLNKEAIHLYLNDYHTPFFDTLFRCITEFGGSLPVFFCLAAFFFSVRAGAFITVAELSASAVTAILKPIFAVDRPKVLFESLNLPLYTIEGLHIHSHNSFPSGHTTAAFALFFAICLVVKNRTLKFACFLMALLTGFSRIYLSQHFLEDVFAGSAIATVTALLCYPFFDDSQQWGKHSLQAYIAAKRKKQ